MIRKLRKKLIIINVISVGVVFLFAVLFTFGSGYRRIADERSARLVVMLDYEDWYDDIADTYRGSAVIEYGTESEQIIRSSYSSEFNISSDQLLDIVQKVVAQHDDDGSISNRVQYAKKTVDDTERIVLFDRFNTASTISRYVWYTLLTLFVGILSYFVISLVLARIALASVENNWTKQKQFVADASHELKTPLSVIMANTEIIASHADETVASQMKWIENTRSESLRMAELVNDLLFLAKNDDGHKAPMEVVNLSECVETIVLSQESLFYENGKAFSYEIAPHVNIFGNMGQLKQLVTILLDNANKYSVDEGNIRLEMQAVGKHASLTVSNACVQLTNEQLSHLFDRFYTVDESRNKNVTGNGLGLAIAQVICRTHRGDITVDFVDGTITFTATFPLYKNNAKKDSLE